MFDNCKNKQELNAQMKQKMYSSLDALEDGIDELVGCFEHNCVAAGKEALITLDKIADDVKIIVSQYKLKETELENKEQMTNEEWFVTLSTEEKAKTIICLAVNSMHKKRKGLINSDVGEIMRWLKQPHSEVDRQNENLGCL